MTLLHIDFRALAAEAEFSCDNFDDASVYNSFLGAGNCIWMCVNGCHAVPRSSLDLEALGSPGWIQTGPSRLIVALNRSFGMLLLG